MILQSFYSTADYHFHKEEEIKINPQQIPNKESLEESVRKLDLLRTFALWDLGTDADPKLSTEELLQMLFHVTNSIQPCFPPISMAPPPNIGVVYIRNWTNCFWPNKVKQANERFEPMSHLRKF
ncbi:hypothetical protein IV203_030411 [Nitzschia inconspicua]|uniref:Uncharacterized protein n=1 Tax=Nitzschia inconspicua TaxID=303405 RepID=A0A9K3LTP7_9STRA|nr:hypothetical protein IV203_025515 [Nitzschia inconspicua]KAG7367740.1 hypothetical protein IV203_030411 [Nitzschia inconspicua]